MSLIILAQKWIGTLVAFVLGKRNRVDYGLLKQANYDAWAAKDVKDSKSVARKLLAVPFVALDVPSPSSEFADLDVTIGLTLLAYRYEGMRDELLQASALEAAFLHPPGQHRDCDAAC